MMGVPRFKLQFHRRRIPELAECYASEQPPDARAEERRLIKTVGPAVRKRGHYELREFVDLCLWKSQRAKKRYQSLPKSLVVEATRAALAARDDRLRIGVLTLLDGVSWPTASVLLHFGHLDPYPILDVRALESLGVSQPSSYTFDFWWAYVSECRWLAGENNVDIRTLDRALWQYSKRDGR